MHGRHRDALLREVAGQYGLKVQARLLTAPKVREPMSKVKSGLEIDVEKYFFEKS